MGLISPFLVTAKLCFQRTWQLKLGWDEILPDDIRHQWADWCDDLGHLSRIQVPRFYEYGLSDVADTRVLHVFADASTAAYGAVVYLCVRDLTGRTTTTLVLAKSRIAPLKQLTLPRLELMASLVASRLFQYIGGNLKLDVSGVHFWTDSMITLHWIQGDAARWKPFVRNRVTEIQKNSDSHPWHYCPSKENPADLMTRGISAQRLIESQLWWKGPPWIVSDESSWPGRPPTTRFASEELEEMKSQVLTTATSTSTVPVLLDINKYSSVLKLHRTTAWVLRYIHNLKSHVRRSGVLSTEEIEKAEVHWITTVQRMTFQHELSCIEKGSKLPSNSPLRDLTPFIDNDGIIRAGGRLQFSRGTYDERHPRILPGDHHYTKLLVRQTHHQLLHAGIRDTLVQLRENFWVTRARRLVKRVIHDCVTCKRLNAKAASETVAPLPADRVTECLPFEVVGIDFAGPLMVKEASSTKKRYIVLFVCAVTRAIHLELSKDMSSKSFLQALRRFVSRRGLCRIVYSDNFLSFKRSRSELKELWLALRDPVVKDHFSTSKIEWRFIMERAPWWGGFYERLVRSVKTSLKKVLGRKLLDTEEIVTILTEVEAVINSRPITFLYSNSSEEMPISPAHFLVGKRLTSLPTPQCRELTSTKLSLDEIWTSRQRGLAHFWKRWHKEYLAELQSSRSSRVFKSSALKPGDIVILHDEKQPRPLWKLCRIVDVFCGRDEKVRACTVRLPDGTLRRRPVQLLYPLELANG
ncbi:uncharacterized protein LOC135392275 [Ornithodoros turicata]|uniref:uncharacterized protein LOC135392275 n=1 Tax=Ornithodoros turicata TaxID=34597 RepID=UPI0031395F9E